MQPPEGVTQLLVDWSHGDQKALDKLMPLVYSELRRLASNYSRRERAGHTLQPTALVTEAYLKLISYTTIANTVMKTQFWNSRKPLICPEEGAMPLTLWGSLREIEKTFESAIDLMKARRLSVIDEANSS